METEKYQKELFEFESPKKPAVRFDNIFPRTDFALVLTPEKMVFAAIGIMMLMVIFFALGVEKGRTSANNRFVAARTTVKEAFATPAVSVKPVAIPIVVAKSPVATNITPRASAPQAIAKAQVTQPAFDKTKPYMVIAAAFSKRDLAQKEIGKLKAAGLDAFVYYGEPYYLACVGSFRNKDAAGKVLNAVKRMHKDAYVRLR
jgi:cell division protein FtsN